LEIRSLNRHLLLVKFIVTIQRKKYKRSKKRLDMVFGQKSKNVLAVSNRFNFDVRVAQATGSKLLGYKRHALP
jgi:hypothetical protein